MSRTGDAEAVTAAQVQQLRKVSVSPTGVLISVAEAAAVNRFRVMAVPALLSSGIS